MKTFAEFAKDYSTWKLQEKGTGKITKNELRNLRENYKQISERNKQPSLREAAEKYIAWRAKEKGVRSNKLTETEIKLLKESLRKEPLKESNQKWEIYLSNYKKFKETKEPGAKITYKELKVLKESFKNAQINNIRLREADAGYDPTQVNNPIPGDPNAMNQAGGVSQVDPTVAAQIQDVLQSVNALATSAGIDVNPVGADPAAGIPPVDGTQPPTTDPMTQGQQMMESIVTKYINWKKENKGTSKLEEAEIQMLAQVVHKKLMETNKQKPKTKYESIKERIAARQEKLQQMNENYLDIPTVAEMGNKNTKLPSTDQKAGYADDAPGIPNVPSASQLANGYTSGKASKETKAAKTWPTKAMGKEAGGALQGASATQSKVKETEECDDEDKNKLEENIIDKGVKTVTDVYVENFLQPKLDFNAIRESMKSGLLG